MPASQAIQNSIALVKRAEKLGYHRYWFAEHHNTASFASAAPTEMIAFASAVTSRIRLGSGGMLMGHGRPLEVAEAFRTLSALAPNRIDLGMGRAPGGDVRVMDSLGFDPSSASQRITETLQYLNRSSEPLSTGDLVAVPSGESNVEPWILGTSPGSASFAAKMGLPFAFGSFIDPTNLTHALSTYHQEFVPSALCPSPKTIVALVVFCADTDAKAREISKCSEAWFIRSFLRGENVRFPSSGSNANQTAQESVIAALRRETVIIGDKRSCHQQIEAFAKATAANELSIVTITEHQEDRLRSYELLAET